jgi:hypothetical protein
VFLIGEIRQISTWKIWFWPIRRIFHETTICQILKKTCLHIIRFLWYVPVGSQEYRRILFIFYFRSQIWLNHLMDARHFSYITKLVKIIIKKTTLNPCISPLAWSLGLWLLLNGQSIIWLSWQVDISLCPASIHWWHNKPSDQHDLCAGMLTPYYLTWWLGKDVNLRRSMVFQGKMSIHNEITEVEIYFPDLPWSQIILKQSIASFRVGDLPGIHLKIYNPYFRQFPTMPRLETQISPVTDWAQTYAVKLLHTAALLLATPNWSAI